MGDIEIAQSLFDNMPCRDLVSWNSLISGYTQNGGCFLARRLFEIMGAENIRSDCVAIINLVSAAAEVGGLHYGRWVYC